MTQLTTIPVKISFQGTAEIKVPAGLTPAGQMALAEKLTVSRIIASFENPDGPEDEACSELAAELGIPKKDTEVLWDASQCDGIFGTWTSNNPKETKALANFMERHGIPWIRIEESQEADNLYELSFETETPHQLYLTATYFGCPASLEPPSVTCTTAGDHWHGKGEGNLRELADQLIRAFGNTPKYLWVPSQLKKIA